VAHEPGTPGAPTVAGVAVRLEELRRSFGGVHALDGLTLELDPGELVALLGPSGCGKTTALRVLAGLEDADSGRVVVGGRDLSSVSANKRDMGMVFQAYSLFPHMTALENVAFGLRLRGVGGAERRRRAGAVLELVGLSAQADRYAHQLSGGQQQRVALARALAIRPQVLLLDEPLSALDAKVRSQLRDEIRRVQLEVGTTTLFVTHDQDEALAIADRVGVMRSGRLEQVAPPDEIYSRPVSQFVAEFVGITNRLPGVAADGHAEVLGTRVPLLPGSRDRGSVQVLVRPESVEVSPAADGAARVMSTSFLGAIGQVKAQTEDGNVVVSQIESAAVERLVPGTRVQLRVRPVPALAVAAE
jgi:putative spermidine/putrescine transport system ATP-binding protein